jgi:hypothetical protein
MRVALTLSLLLLSPIAAACSFIELTPAEFDQGLAKPVDVAPPPPAVAIEAISRGSANNPLSSCADTGVAVLSIPATAANKGLVFSFDLVSGNTDDRIFPPGLFTGFEGNGKIQFVFPWVDGASDKQEPLDLVVRVTPYLHSGLAGAPTEVRIKDNGR